jgi:hypothetical protein
LAAYAEAAGETDPFVRLVLGTSVGGLDPPLFLEALYRIETAASIAWAFGLAELPSIEERADAVVLCGLFPLDGPPADSIISARKRELSEIAVQLSNWRSRLASARERADQSPNDEAAGIQRSRAFERTRGLLWITTDVPNIEDTQMPQPSRAAP